MRESNSRAWGHNPAPKPFGQSRHQIWSWPSASNPRRKVTSCLGRDVTDQQTLELARSLELRSGAYRAPALPVELYQRSWRGDSNADHGLTRPALFLLSYTSTKIWRWRGELLALTAEGNCRTGQVRFTRRTWSRRRKKSESWATSVGIHSVTRTRHSSKATVRT